MDCYCYTLFGGARAQSLGSGSEFRVQSTGGLGFSERVAAPTLLSCPVFNNGQGARHGMRQQGK